MSTLAWRDVPLAPVMARRLWERRARGSDDTVMFTTLTGAALDDSNLRKVLTRAARGSGVPWVTPHTFRHTLASMLFAEGYNAKQVAGWLGHRDPAFTLRTYVHLMDDGLGAADFLDAITGVNKSANKPALSGPKMAEVA